MKFCFAVVLSLVFSIALLAKEKPVNVDKRNLAVYGYDVVSYLEGRAIEGNSSIQVVYEGHIYRFESTGNKEKFLKQPNKFLPAYGGYCAYAMLDGEKVDIDPERFKIVGGRLFLFYDGIWGNTLKKWNQMTEAESESLLVKKADEHWDKL
jgi:YHS domain-containing protein